MAFFPLWLWGVLVFALIINGSGDTRQFSLVDTYTYPWQNGSWQYSLRRFR
jgi:hypothetical protein